MALALLVRDGEVRVLPTAGAVVDGPATWPVADRPVRLRLR